MRILLVHHTWPSDSRGGSEIYMAALARGLAVAHEVSVLYRTADLARPDHAVTERREGAVRVFALNNAHRAAPGFEAYRDPGAAAAAARVLDELRPELVHVGHLSGLSTGLVFAARERGAAVVFALHDFATLCALGQLLTLELSVCPGPTPRRCLGCVGGQALAPSAGAPRGLASLPLVPQLARLVARGSARGERRIGARLEEMRETLRAADVRIAPSRFLRERFEALGVSDIEVVPNGHEAIGRRPRRASMDGRLRVGFVGAVIPSKGVHVLVDAVTRLADPRLSLEIHGPALPYHGDTGYEARLRAQLGPASDGILRGAFDHPRLGDVLAGLDVLVVPSLWEENAPLVVDEARAAGVPLVVSDHGGLAEQVREGVDGLRFRPADAADLARVLRRLLDEPGLLEQLGSHPTPLVTLEAHVERLEPVYRRALERRQARAGRVGVVVLDRAAPGRARQAMRSAVPEALASRRLIVENGPGPEAPVDAGVEVLRLPANVGFAAGMNAGLRKLRAGGCDRILLLNNDAVLEPGGLRRLSEALEDPTLAAVGPVVLRAHDGRVESRGLALGASLSRVRLLGFGEEPEAREGLVEVQALSGAAWMLSAVALERVGELDESYFHSFEDVDWCVRARRAGLRLAVVLGARARHEGSATLGPGSSDRFYYASRSHLRAAARLAPRGALASAVRSAAIVGLNLLHAGLRGASPAAVLEGARDFRRGRSGARRAGE